ncbi:putative nuclease HARBI1 [Gigantopelta aegis]|uniref:putative nuclease HARBI1 n=1 Tax=Gigantopelta aegis TaxID=1735272 RepID=UPI001B888E5B|nr:putative nuclease HARBI1 [Gigantopelta aegis]
MTAALVAILDRRRIRRRQAVPRVIRDRNNPLDFMNDVELQNKYRLDRDGILYPCNKLQLDLERSTRRSGALPLSLQVIAALRYFATGSFQAVTGDVHGLSRFSVSRCVHTVSRSIVNKLMKIHIKFPRENNEIRSVKRDLYNLADFPNVLGALDGTLIPIKDPSIDEHLYFSHKGYHAINVQCVVSAKGVFLDIVAKWPCATHDALIWRNCDLAQQFETGHIKDGWLLGESGYSLKPWLMTPVSNPTTRQERAYNRSHKITRCSCERAFGVWKSRWRCLHKSGGGMMFVPDGCVYVIVATAVLENICKERNIPCPDNGEDECESSDEEEEDDEHDATYHQHLRDGAITRQQLIQIYFNN